MDFSTASDTTNQTTWAINVRHKDHTLLDSGFYRKIHYKFAPKSIKLIPEFGRFVPFSTNEDVLD